MLFQIFPTIADIIVALVYFLLMYDAYFALIIFVTMALYLGKVYVSLVKVYVSLGKLYALWGKFPARIPHVKGWD